MRKLEGLGRLVMGFDVRDGMFCESFPLPPRCIACYLTFPYVEKNPFLASFPFLGLLRTAFLIYVVNHMDNSPKWVFFNIVSSQIASDTLWK